MEYLNKKRKELGFQRQTLVFCLKPLESIEKMEWMMNVLLSAEDGNKLTENLGNIIVCALGCISFG